MAKWYIIEWVGLFEKWELPEFGNLCPVNCKIESDSSYFGLEKKVRCFAGYKRSSTWNEGGGGNQRYRLLGHVHTWSRVAHHLPLPL